MSLSVVRVLIIDDQALFRRGLHKLLEVENGVEVVGEATNGIEALGFLETAEDHLIPHVALADARMPRMDGVELIGQLSKKYPQVAAIVLTTFEEDSFIFGGFQAGARGHLLKDAPPDDLISAIWKVRRGEKVIGATAAERILAALDDPGAWRKEEGETAWIPAPDGAPPEKGADGADGGSTSESMRRLTAREQEVARLVGAGASNAEIAAELFITEGTAKNHVTNILRKLDVRDRTQLALRVNRSRN